MRRHVLVLLVALAGCKVVRSSGVDAAAVDAKADAWSRPDAGIDESRMPFTTVGTTPAGSLDDVRFIDIAFLTGFCQAGYYVDLYRTKEYFEEAVVTVHIPIEPRLTEPPTGSIMATAWPGEDYTQSTDAVSFAIVQLDIPPTDPMRVAGRVTIATGAWNMDFTIDALTTSFTCI